MKTNLSNEEMKAGRFLKRQTGKRKVDFIQGSLAKGGTVFVQTMTRIVKLTQKHASMVKLGASGSVYINRDCIDYCKLTAHV